MNWRTGGARWGAIVLGAALLGTAWIPAAYAGAWINTNSVQITRTLGAGGNYDVEICFTVRRSARDLSGPMKVMVCVSVVEDDGPCFLDDVIFCGKEPICVPKGGGSEKNTLTYSYPCTWGDDIQVEFGNMQGFTGASVTESNLPLGPAECGPGMEMGTLSLTETVVEDSDLVLFFTQNTPNPIVGVSRGKDAQTGEDVLVLDTTTLEDPKALGYGFYHARGYSGNLEVWDLPLATAGSGVDPNTLTDDEMIFGEPAANVTLPAGDYEVDVDRVVIELTEAGPDHPTIPVFEGAVTGIPDHVLARWGTTNAGVGVPYDVILINGSRGDGRRVVSMTPDDVLNIEFSDYPGTDGAPIPYALYVLNREAQEDDLTPHPFDLGDACFSTAVTGGNALLLLNTLGRRPQLGSPRVENTPLGPGDVLSLSRQTGFPEVDLTFQAIVPDGNAVNGLASLSNAVVVRIGG